MQVGSGGWGVAGGPRYGVVRGVSGCKMVEVFAAECDVSNAERGSPSAAGSTLNIRRSANVCSSTSQRAPHPHPLPTPHSPHPTVPECHHPVTPHEPKRTCLKTFSLSSTSLAIPTGSSRPWPGSRSMPSFAKDGEEAIRVLDASAPRLIVLSSVVPKVSTSDLIRAIRGRDALKDTPILLTVSGYRGKSPAPTPSASAPRTSFPSRTPRPSFSAKCSRCSASPRVAPGRPRSTVISPSARPPFRPRRRPAHLQRNLRRATGR